MYSTAIFVGMLTGNSIAQIVLTYFLHLLPVAVILLFGANISTWLYGFSLSDTYKPFFDKLPLYVLIDYRPVPSFLQAKDILVYLLFTLFFFVAAGYLYEKRNLEYAGDIIAFGFFRPVFKYGFTTLTMLLGGLYFKSMSFGSLYMVLLGYLLSSLFAYTLAEILIQKSFRVWSAYRGYLVYLVVILLLLAGVRFDVFGYVHRIPELDEIDKVYFGSYSNAWTIEDPNSHPIYKDIPEANLFFKEPGNIKNITKLHTQIIQNPTHKTGGSARYIVYILKNGKYQVRYYIYDENQFDSLLTPIYESMEYKRAKFPVLNQEPKDIEKEYLEDFNK